MKRGDPQRFRVGQIDMTGRTILGFRVVDIAEHGNGTIWNAEHVVCGTRIKIIGTRLRAAERTPDRDLLKYACPKCAPKRPGRVTRRTTKRMFAD
jgi:hypothetical protein